MNKTDIDTRTDSTFNGNPFVGLRPFNSDEGLLFFGRQEQAAELMRKLHQTRFLGVVGSSGCGKSSLIRAGLIPKLKAGLLVGDRDQWRIAIMKPGDAPLRNLAVALFDAATGVLNPATPAMLEEIDLDALIKSFRRAGARAVIDYMSKHTAISNTNLLLLVDQFEELFHFGIETGDPKKRDEAADFVSIMLELAEQRALPIYVVMTMRSDYLGECDNFYGLPEALNLSQYLVPRLTRQQRQQAIEGPIRLFGEKISLRLVDRVLNDVGDQLDQLPVMQHALLRTWDNWRRSGAGAIDCPHYEEAGTIKRALSDDADSALEGMSDEERKITERMFQALTNVDTRNRRVRRQTHLSELQEITGAGREQLLKIIDCFRGEGRCFLKVEDDKLTDDPLVDISHESLIRQWKQLNIWLNSESDWRDIYVRLADDAERYRRGQVDLWRDPQLQIALHWHADRKPNKAWAERYHPGFDAAIAFMEKSRAEREAEAEREEARRKKELAEALEREEARRKQLRRNRLFSIFLTLALFGSFMAGGYTFRLKAQAESAKLQLVRKNEDLDKARDNEKKYNETLQSQIRKNLEYQNKLEIQKGDLEAAKFRVTKALEAAKRSAEIAKQSEALAKDQAERAEKQSAITSQRVAQLLGLHSVYLAPAGENDSEAMEKRALLAAQSLRMRTSSGEPLPTVEGVRAARAILSLAPRIVKTQPIYAYGGGAALSQDAKSLATLTSNKDAQLIDPVTGKSKINLGNLPDGVAELSISRDGKYLAVSSIVGTIEDVPGARDKSLNAATGSVKNAIQIQTFRTDDGRWVGQPIALQVPYGLKQNLLVSPDGSRLVTFTIAEAQLWDTARGVPVSAQRPDLPKTNAQDSAPSAQQRRAPNQAARALVQTFEQSLWRHRVTGGAFSHDGKRLATIHTSDQRSSRGYQPESAISRLFFWDTETGAQIGSPVETDQKKNEFFSFVAFSPDGKYLLTILREITSSAPSATIQLRDSQTGELITSATNPPDCKEAVFNSGSDALAVTTEGNQVVKLAIVNDDGSVNLKKESLIYYGAKPDAVAFSKDGLHLTVISVDGEMTVTETQTKPAVKTIPISEASEQSIAFTPDGRLLITKDGRNIKVWNSPDEQSPDGRLTDVVLPAGASTIPPMAVAFSDNGAFLATMDEYIRIWDTSRGRLLNQPGRDRIRLAAFSPNGDHWALIGEDGSAVMAINGNILPLRLPDAGAATKAIAISAAEDEGENKVMRLVIADRTGVVRIKRLIPNEAGRGELVELRQFRHRGAITAMTFLKPDHGLLAIASGSEVRIWDVTTGRQFGASLEHTGQVNDLAIRPGTGNLVAACQDGTIIVWVMNQNQDWELKQSLDFAAPVEKVVFSRNGEFLIAAGSGKAQLWNASTWRQIGMDVKVGKVVDLMMQETSARAFWVLEENGICRLWRPETGQPMSEPFTIVAEGGKAFFNQTRNLLITGGVSFPIVHEMNASFPRKLQALDWTSRVRLSPDGKYLASRFGGAITIRRTDDMRQFHTINPDGDVTIFSFTHDGNLLTVSQKTAGGATTGAASARIEEVEDVWQMEIWDAATSELVGKTVEIKGDVDAIALSPTDNIFATLNSGEDDKARVVFWKRTGAEIKQLKGKQISHRNVLTDLVFSPDGRFLVAIGADGVHIWEVEIRQDEVLSRQEVAEIPGTSTTPVFSQNGRYLAFASVSDAVIEVAHWRHDDLADDACARLRRNFTQDEWQQYLTDDRPYELTCRNWEAHQSVIDEAIRLAKAGEKVKAAALFNVMRDLKNKPVEEAEWHQLAAQKLDKINEKMPWRKRPPDERRNYVGASENEEVIKRGLREAILLFEDFKKFNQTHPHTFNPNRMSGAQNKEERNTPARILNGLCWYGSLFGYANNVRDACDIAVELDPKFWEIADSRGMARALTNDYKGAIADFEVFIRKADDADERKQRKGWTEALRKCLEDQKNCRFPLTEEELKKVRGQ
jgi:WD40 repeat protein/energy-coupling factor transporter ATP-binding protein EcfA2